MDHRTNTVYVDFRGLNDRTAYFLELFIRAKGLIPKRISFDKFQSQIPPAVIFRAVQVEGLWPTLNYIQDIIRYPDLMPDTPGKRGLVSTLVSQLLAGLISPDQFEELYHPEAGPFMNGATEPNLLDLALAASCYGRRDLPYYALRVSTGVLKHLEKKYESAL